jgi:DNA-binding MarR family transcriptional regulator
MSEKTQPEKHGTEHTENAVALELPRLIERMHRHYLDVLGPALTRFGADDISPVQFMMLLHLTGGEISVRELIERGHYLGSNATYNLKQLTECGYIERLPSPRDKRAARLKLTERGAALVTHMREQDRAIIAPLYEQESMAALFESTYKALRQLENRWSEILRTESATMLDFME